MTSLRIAMAQINPTLGDLEGNVARITSATARARQAGAEVVTFPELAVCGYPPEDLLLRPRFLRDTRAALDAVARASAGIVAVVGFVDTVEDQVYNAAAVIHDMQVVGTYHKVELPNYGVFDEERYFRSGTGCLVVDLGEVRLSVSVCEDVWVEGGSAEQGASGWGADVVLNLSASPFHAGKVRQRRAVLAGFARRTGATVCYTNLVGGQDELVFDGGSLVMDPRGEVVAGAARFREDLLVADVVVSCRESGPGPSAGRAVPGGAAERGDRHVVLDRAIGPDRPAVAPAVAPELDRLEEIHQALMVGTHDYTRKNGFSKVVLGLSGGVDSALTAAVAVGALGAANVIGVTMPSRYTSEGTRTDASRVAENLGIRLVTVPIEGIFTSYVTALADPFREGRDGLELENLQARIRGNILMALSNRFGWLVLTTGNKSETAMGYCTLYGDMAGGLAVIKDVPKTLVYELSSHINAEAGRATIPASVLDRPPSAELRRDQKDEDSLPRYAVLDPILEAYVEEDRSPDELVASGFDARIVDEVVRMVDRCEYKRRQAPPGVRITPKAFGRDRRLPMTNQYRPGTTRGG